MGGLSGIPKFATGIALEASIKAPFFILVAGIQVVQVLYNFYQDPVNSTFVDLIVLRAMYVDVAPRLSQEFVLS